MALTVITAFDEFLKDPVNLDPQDSSDARNSKDWLVGQIKAFPNRDEDFPLLYEERDIDYGSFARRTKIRPLDDVDLISCLHATGATYLETAHDDIAITVSEESRLHQYCNDGTTTLNSRKIINRYVRALSAITHYRRAEINRRGEAATLKLSSYDWNFDIVPAFFTSPDNANKTYYLIPNGAGNWKKTDPRKDRDRVQNVNQRHGGNMLNVIRIIKYWQRRATMPTMPSYLVECIVVDYYSAKYSVASKFVDLELESVLRFFAYGVLAAVPDPKGIESDINTLSWDERIAIHARALLDADRVNQARTLEEEKDFRRAINVWRDVFGPEFPEYG